MAGAKFGLSFDYTNNPDIISQLAEQTGAEELANHAYIEGVLIYGTAAERDFAEEVFRSENIEVRPVDLIPMDKEMS